MERRLAAILVADVVGYSRMMGEDEAGTLAAVRDHRANIFAPGVAAHGGRIVKLMGDGVLAEFGSAREAVAAAAEIQKASAEGPVTFRMGVNLGDVIVEDDDIFGDGVNIAARLEALADPGGVCISAKVHAEVDGKLDLAFEDLGPTTLKNIRDRVRVFRVALGEAPAAPRLTPPDRPSIAVLPFVDMAGGDQDFFADGVTDEIVTALSRLRSFFVISRNTMVTYKGEAISAARLASELGVRYVLEGGVRAAGRRVRVTAQLTDAAAGKQLWAERYDRALDDVFAIQDEITESVVGRIEPEIFAAEHDRLKRKPPQNLDAWECFVRARFLYGQHSDASTREARVLLDRAIALDPDYAEAHGLSGVALAWRAVQGWEDGETAFARATEIADRAIACDPDEPWGYIAHGFVNIATRRPAEALAAFQSAADISPNFAYAHGLLGATHALSGQPDLAMVCIDRAARLSPRDVFSEEYDLYRAFAHFQAARYPDAALSAAAAIRKRPGHPNLYVMAAASNALAGEAERARETGARLLALRPDLTAAGVETVFPYTRAEDRARLADGLRKAGVP